MSTLREAGSATPSETELPTGPGSSRPQGPTSAPAEEAGSPPAPSEESARWKLIVSAANVGLFDWDLKTDRVVYSPEWKRQIGYSEEEISNRFDEWESRVHPDDLEPTLRQVRSFIANPGSRHEVEFRFRHRDGRYLWIYTIADVLPDRDGKPTHLLGCHIDITERRMTEAALRDLNATLEQRVGDRTKALQQSEELNRQTLQALPSHIAVLDREGRIIATNQAWDTFAMANGAKANPLVAVGANYLDVCRRAAVTDRTAVDALSGLEAVMSGRSAHFAMDYTCNSPTRNRWFAMTAVPLRDAEGGGAVVTHSDITKRVEAERALAESQWLLAEAQRGAHFGSWRWDLETGEVRWSPELYALYGLDPKNYTPSIDSFRRFVHPDDRAMVAETIKKIVRLGAPIEFDFRIVTESGGVRVLLTKGEVTQLDDRGRPRVMTGINLDITARKDVEKALALSEERLRLATTAGKIGIFTIDVQTRTLQYSAGLSDIAGSPGLRDERIEDALLRIHPDDQERLRRSFKAALDPGGTGRLDMELRVARPEGEVRWLVLNGQVAFDSRPTGRQPVRIVGTFHDVTERKRADEALAQANEALEARVAERTQQYESEMKLREHTQAELAQAQRVEALGQLTGGIAHDFNNLLTVVSGNLELAEARISDETARRFVQQAIEAVQMGASLNRRLLSFARRRNLEPQRLVLNDRVTEMQRLLQRTLGEEIALVNRLQGTLWPLLADPGEVDSAIINIAINARDAMPLGGMLTISTGNERLGSELARKAGVKEGDYVCLTLTDTGQGMPPEVLQRAIEPFFTTKDTGKGTGLGLSSVYGFVRQSGGVLDISSEVGRGTTVKILLPRAPDGQTAARTGSPTERVPTGDGELILVVEDNDQVRAVTLGRLEALGYAVIEARSGPEAIAALGTDAPVSLVFSDVLMPGGMSGYDVARWVRKERPDLKVLLTSGNHESIRREPVDTTGRRVLAKPYTYAQLGRAVHEALGG
ncbi:PAS domain-containing hybrid sensor histidine kinase/response regulator [Alsobacter sp. R-9]